MAYYRQYSIVLSSEKLGLEHYQICGLGQMFNFFKLQISLCVSNNTQFLTHI